MAISRIATEVQMGEPSLFSQEMFLGGVSLLQLPYLIFLNGAHKVQTTGAISLSQTKLIIIQKSPGLRRIWANNNFLKKRPKMKF